MENQVKVTVEFVGSAQEAAQFLMQFTQPAEVPVRISRNARVEIYRQALANARASGTRYREAAQECAALGAPVGTHGLMQWAQRHGCDLPRISSDAQLAARRACMAKARDASAAKRASINGAAAAQ